jgi:hypothetical protein
MFNLRLLKNVIITFVFAAVLTEFQGSHAVKLSHGHGRIIARPDPQCLVKLGIKRHGLASAPHRRTPPSVIPAAAANEFTTHGITFSESNFVHQQMQKLSLEKYPKFPNRAKGIVNSFANETSTSGKLVVVPRMVVVPPGTVLYKAMPHPESGKDVDNKPSEYTPYFFSAGVFEKIKKHSSCLIFNAALPSVSMTAQFQIWKIVALKSTFVFVGPIARTNEKLESVDGEVMLPGNITFS